MSGILLIHKKLLKIGIKLLNFEWTMLVISQHDSLLSYYLPTYFFSKLSFAIFYKLC